MFSYLRTRRQKSEFQEFLTSQSTHPPKDIAVPAVPTGLIIDHEQKLISQIQHRFVHNKSNFEIYLRPIIELAARYFHLLPASQAYHHDLYGGLFSHSLDVAYRTMQPCQQFERQLIIDQNPSLNPMYVQIVTFFLAIFHDIGKITKSIKVTYRDQQWNPYKYSLYDWLNDHSIPHYKVIWDGKNSIVHDLSTQSWLGILTNHMTNIFPYELTSAIFDVQSDKQSSFMNLIRISDGQSAKDYLSSHITTFTEKQKRQILIEAISDYLNSVKINHQGSGVLYTNQGIYINKVGQRHLMNYLMKQSTPGLSFNFANLTSVLKKHQLITHQAEDMNYFFHSICHNLNGSKTKEEAIQLHSLFDRRLDNNILKVILIADHESSQSQPQTNEKTDENPFNRQKIMEKIAYLDAKANKSTSNNLDETVPDNTGKNSRISQIITMIYELKFGVYLSGKITDGAYKIVINEFRKTVAKRFSIDFESAEHLIKSLPNITPLTNTDYQYIRPKVNL